MILSLKCSLGRDPFTLDFPLGSDGALSLEDFCEDLLVLSRSSVFWLLPAFNRFNGGGVSGSRPVDLNCFGVILLSHVLCQILFVS